MEDDAFYEDDEPVEVIRAILDRPADGVTTPRREVGVVLTGSFTRLSGNRVERPGTRVS